MKLKTGVSILGVRSELVLGMFIASSVYRMLMLGVMVITSVTDGRHSRTSLHYLALAFDIRTRDESGVQWPKSEKYGVAKALREALGEDFDVVVERTHIHIEYQPKRQK